MNARRARRVSYRVEVSAAVASREAIVEVSCAVEQCQESSLRLVHVVPAPLARQTVMTVPTPPLTIEIDRHRQLPIHLQICERFRTAIAAGHLHPGDRVPALRGLATQLNTARGTNTAFLFSLQSLPQLLEVGKGFQQDVSSAPGTTMLMQTRDEETAKYFKQASSQIPVQKRTQQLWRNEFLGFERYDKALGASEREQLEFRALDHHIKNLGKGKMEILMTDPIQGTLHGRLHVRPPSDVRVPLFEPTLLPKLESSREDTEGANLRFKDQKLAAMVAFPRRR